MRTYGMLSQLARRTGPLILAASAVSGLLVLASPARAQGQGPACGDTIFAARQLERDFALFTDPNKQWSPRTGITRLSPSDVHRVVTDPRECRRVLHAATRLPPRRKWGKHWVYRFGPYYGVEILGKRPFGYASLLIYRAADMKYLTLILN
jgi:hypothetical protein